MNDKKNKVSVIVPVWGVERYIEKCARSLFEQTLDEIEFIFVDDCTPDKSIAVLKEVMNTYPARVNQTKIICHSQNRGLPQARRTGVEAASGEYLIFCDSDDYVEKEMYSTMYEYAISNHCDLVHCDIDVVSDNGLVKSLTARDNHLSSDDLRQLIVDGDISNSLCNKLVKRTIYQNHDIVFPQFGMNEDNAVAIQLAYYSKNLGYINKSFYKAYVNNSSMSRIPGEEQQNKKYQESLENSRFMVDFLVSNGYDVKSKAMLRAKMRPKIVLFTLLYKVKYVKTWRETYPEVNRMALVDKRLPFGVRVRSFFTLTYLYPVFYKYLTKWH